jgi:hypothetical protein
MLRILNLNLESARLAIVEQGTLVVEAILEVLPEVIVSAVDVSDSVVNQFEQCKPDGETNLFCLLYICIAL